MDTFDELAGAFRTVLDEVNRAVAERTLREKSPYRPTISLDSSISAGPIDKVLSTHGLLNGAPEDVERSSLFCNHLRRHNESPT